MKSPNLTTETQECRLTKMGTASTWVGTITDIYSDDPELNEAGIVVIRLNNGYVTGVPSLFNLKAGDRVKVLNIKFIHPEDLPSNKTRGICANIVIPE